MVSDNPRGFFVPLAAQYMAPEEEIHFPRIIGTRERLKGSGKDQCEEWRDAGFFLRVFF